MKYLIASILFILCSCGGGGNESVENIDCGSDINCDGKMKIAVFGDSIVRGVGDNIDGGYVSRLSSEMPHIEFQNFGIPGITSNELLEYIRSVQGIDGVDQIFISVGVNDYWNRKSPKESVYNIVGILNVFIDYYENRGLKVPSLKVMTLTPSTRIFQLYFIDEVNALLLDLDIAEVRFDTLNIGFISNDGLHPTPDGYEQLKEIFKKNI